MIAARSRLRPRPHRRLGGSPSGAAAQPPVGSTPHVRGVASALTAYPATAQYPHRPAGTVDIYSIWYDLVHAHHLAASDETRHRNPGERKS